MKSRSKRIVANVAPLRLELSRMPAYLALHASGELHERARRAAELLDPCVVCPRACKARRVGGETGVCGVGRLARVASHHLHFGEEAPLVGRGGSGTIFFAGCNLGCTFCQNFDISRPTSPGRNVEPEDLAAMMIELQRAGAQNVNLVTPSHVVVQILEALPIAVERGLSVPLVYNTGSYDSVDTLRLLDGVVDVYMPDTKVFFETRAAELFHDASDYPERARAAIREMHRQVGDLVIDPDGVARRGVLVRHLVMPAGVAGTDEWMRFLARLSPNTYVNIMDQYHPAADARRHGVIGRFPHSEELSEAFSAATRAGLSRFG
jgi:putative pyruvate formate lyase activating enzyme